MVPPLLSLGDNFNMVRHPHEKSGMHTLNPQMVAFYNFIACNGLIDVQLDGARFTWSNNHDSPARSLLDIFLFSPNWESHFSGLIKRALPNPDSDHIPILLCHGK